MAVFITGVRGFIGSALAERFAALGHVVRGVDTEKSGDGSIVAGDISTAGEWQSQVAGCDLVVHTAAIVNNVAPHDRCWEVNVLGTRRALDAAVVAGAERFVHLSSVRAFSDVAFPDMVDENFPVRPDGHRYVETKIASEQVVLQAHAAGEIDCTIIRPGDVYGPGSVPWTLWPAFAIAKDDFFLPDDGGGIFSPLYVDNLVDGMLLAAASPAAAGHIFTLSDGVAVTNLEFFGHYFAMMGKAPALMPADELRARFAAQEAAAIDSGRDPVINAETVDYFLRTGSYSIAKARRVLGYDPAVDLGEGMRRTEAWLRSIDLLPQERGSSASGAASRAPSNMVT